ENLSVPGTPRPGNDVAKRTPAAGGPAPGGIEEIIYRKEVAMPRELIRNTGCRFAPRSGGRETASGGVLLARLPDDVRAVHGGLRLGQFPRRPGVLARPLDRDPVHLRRLAQAEGDRQFTLAQVPAGAGHFAALRHAAGLQRHPGPDRAAVGAD